MSCKGDCWDTAVAESFFKSLKTELVYGSRVISAEQMELEIFEYIEIWYKKRRHSALNYKTIEEFNKPTNYINALNFFSSFCLHIHPLLISKNKI
jgi:putative transposase